MIFLPLIFALFHYYLSFMDLGKGCLDSIIITGVHTHICGKDTSYDAFTRGLKIKIAEDEVQALSEEENLPGLEYIRKIYGADIKKIDNILDLFVATTQ